MNKEKSRYEVEHKKYKLAVQYLEAIRDLNDELHNTDMCNEFYRRAYRDLKAEVQEMKIHTAWAQ